MRNLIQASTIGATLTEPFTWEPPRNSAIFGAIPAFAIILDGDEPSRQIFICCTTDDHEWVVRGDFEKLGVEDWRFYRQQWTRLPVFTFNEKNPQGATTRSRYIRLSDRTLIQLDQAGRATKLLTFNGGGNPRAIDACRQRPRWGDKATHPYAETSLWPEYGDPVRHINNDIPYGYQHTMLSQVLCGAPAPDGHVYGAPSYNAPFCTACLRVAANEVGTATPNPADKQAVSNLLNTLDFHTYSDASDFPF